MTINIRLRGEPLSLADYARDRAHQELPNREGAHILMRLEREGARHQCRIEGRLPLERSERRLRRIASVSSSHDPYEAIESAIRAAAI